MPIPIDDQTINGMAQAAAKERHEAKRVECRTSIKWGGMSPEYRERQTRDARRYIEAGLRWLEREPLGRP